MTCKIYALLLKNTDCTSKMELLEYGIFMKKKSLLLELATLGDIKGVAVKLYCRDRLLNVCSAGH